MRKLFTFLCAALMSAGMWAETVSWSGNDIPGSGESRDGITITYSGRNGNSINGPGTFTSSIGNFISIKINAMDMEFDGSGWKGGDRWYGDASSVSFGGYMNDIFSITFTFPDPTVAVTGVTLDQNEAQMTVGGETLTLTATVNPEGATDKSVSWSTSDGNVATVENGVVTAVAAGTATITVTTTDGSYTATCAVTVTAPEPENSCGDGVIWELNDGALTISYTGTGTGVMDNYDGEETYAPWVSYYESITSVIISSGVTSIGDLPFFNCIALTSVTIPNSVTSIGAGAFYMCSGLTSITIPNSVESIGMYAFAGCSDLTSVTIPNSVTSIGEGAFQIVPNIVYSGSATGSPWDARSVNGYVDGFLVYSDNTKTNLLACSSQATGTIEIPNSVTSIGDYAFYECSGLETVTINATMPPTLGSIAFEGTAAALKIYVPAGSVDTYKTAWADYADQIEAIPGGGGSTPTGFEITANLDPQTGVYYSTFYHGSVDYALPAKVKAYKAVISGSDLLLSEVAAEGDVLPKGKAVILRSSVQNYTLTPSDATPVSVGDDNDLEGSDVAISAPSNCYVLSGHSSDNSVQGVGFYQFTGTLTAHKAYVIYAPNSQNPAPRRLRFVYDQATGIENGQMTNDERQTTKLLRDGQLIIIRNGVEYNVNGQMIK